ncbi:metabolism of cobalamin associated Da isoform X2 [Brachyistius frenatus]|uniref:metabolism of cobalamin associated Da isoform X2 n=1 Tax=Brachyistius frenatus TaxID=100188 RepID=UPI0037E818B3
MSSSVLCGRSRSALSQAAACHRALVSLRVGGTRTFSAASSDEPYVAASPADSGPRTVWPDENMGPFGPQDRRFQLPGNVGFDCHLEGTEDQQKAPVRRTAPDLLTVPSGTERHQFVLAQFVNEFQGKLGPVSKRVRKAERYFNQSDTDCSFSSCPELLKKDLELLFPSAPATSITVVTVTQKGDRREDEAAEQEGDRLLRKFFASPSSQTSPQTDEQLRHLGFHIEVSGSCTVIRHILRGTPLFVGTVFTNAPPHSSAIAKLQGLSNLLEDEE